MLSSIELKTLSKKLDIDIIGFSSIKDIDLYKEDYYSRVLSKIDKKTLYPRNRMDYKDYINVDKVLDNPKSIISIGINFYQKKSMIKDKLNYSITSYGRDYHHVLEDKVKLLLSHLPSNINYFYQIDTKVLDDRFFAWLCGNGFYGKNTMIINPYYGSACFYATIIIDQEIDIVPFTRLDSLCESCNACEVACPTKCLNDYSLNYKSCLSHLTQTKDLVFHPSLNNSIYGCDICNEVCPFNKVTTTHKDFNDVGYIDLEQLLTMSNASYNESLKLKSMGWINKNIIKKNAILSNLSYDRDINSLLSDYHKLLNDKNKSDLLVKAYEKIIHLKEKENEI